MAGTAVSVKVTGVVGEDLFELRKSHNLLVDDLEALRAAYAVLIAKLNLDAGVTDTNYANVAAATLTGYKVNTVDGVST